MNLENQTLPTPIVDSPQTTVLQSVDQKPKKNNFLVILLSILMLLALAIAGFFAYQTQKLVKELQGIRDEKLATLTPEPIATTDPTIGWKIFTDTKHNFQIKLPDYFNIPNTGLWSKLGDVDYATIDFRQDAKIEESSFLDVSGERYSKSVLLEVSNANSLEDWRKNSKFASSHKFINERLKDDVLIFTTISLGQMGYVDNDRVTGFAVIKDNAVVSVALRHYAANQSEADLFVDQILSTFKFTN